MELLSPAGSYESLIAAVQSGADAVYLGGSKFGARQSAANFEISEMKKWIDYCHLYGVKVYVTVNTLVKDSEIAELAEYIKELSNACVDGILVQDFGVLAVVRSVAPGLDVHASTQMTVTSLDDVRFLENQGISRVVLSRELSLREIQHICDNTSCEVEVFVHGALCMSYSGQCLMSSIIGGRSGNRGRCAQPCRLPYSLEGSGERNDGFLLSPKDLCLIDYISELKKAGVASLKIEGRLKRPEYVSTVVGIYRKCIDESRKVKKDELKQLKDAFGRGFTTGFFGGETGEKMMSIKNSSNVASNKFTKDATERCRENADFRKIKVFLCAKAKVGEYFSATMHDENGNSVSACSAEKCVLAEKHPTGEQRIKESITKFGGTPYVCENVQVSTDGQAIIPASVINDVRRQLCSKMTEMRSGRPGVSTYPFLLKKYTKKRSKPEIVCSVRTQEQYMAAKNAGIKNIILSDGIVGNSEIYQLPPLSKHKSTNKNRLMVSNIGQIEKHMDCELVGSHRLNITNSYSADFYSAFLSRSLLSCELTLKEIGDLVSATELDCGIIAYGRLDLMLCANCPVKASGKCQKGKNVYWLRDRKGEKFPVLCDVGCTARILNSKPVYMADKWNDIENTGVGFVNLVFTVESGKECERIIGEYIKASEGTHAQPPKENTFTRGHFYRGVL